MLQPDGRRIADVLQRNFLSYIAESAAKALGPLSLQEWATAPQTAVRTYAEAAPYGDAPAPRSQDEATRMIVDGFRRLGNVVSVSVLVDEPGLIADDLMWLERMGSALALPLGDRTYVERLVHTYVSACGLVLDGDDLKQVENIVERALAMLHVDEPDPFWLKNDG